MKKIIIITFVSAVYGALWWGAWSPWCAPLLPEPPVAAAPSALSLDADFFSTSIINPDAVEPMSHVSSVALLPHGRVAAVWYAGTRELAGDVRIFISTFDPASNRWSSPRAVATREDDSAALGRYVRKVGNPVVFTTGDESLWLVYVSMPLTGWSGSSLVYRVSHDRGATWSVATRLYLSPLVNLSKVVKNKPVRLENNDLLLPVYHELSATYPEIMRLRPEDGQLRYAIRRMLHTPGLLQPAVVPIGADGGVGGLVVFFRNSSGGDKREVMRSVSTDGGRTWGAPVGVGIPNPDSGIDAVSSGDGRMVMVANDTYSNRSVLSVYRSVDRGASWTKRTELENTPGMEFSYPSIIRTPGGVYHLTYTYGRARIKHATFSEAWLWKNDD